MADGGAVTGYITAWAIDVDNNNRPADWLFTIEDAGIKLERIYP